MKFKKTIATLLALTVSANTLAFELSSKGIAEGKKMSKTFEFKGFGCDGENHSPQLSWKNPPKGTKSFAITTYDPDAPTGSGWWHWLVIDIPANITSVARAVNINEIGGKTIKNDFGSTLFGGACPPENHGMHRYQFTVWALPEATLDVPKNASPALVGFMLNSSALGKAKLTATYVR